MVRLPRIEEGITKGKYEVAQTMLEKCMEVPFIAEMTGLTKEEIEKSRKKSQ